MGKIISTFALVIMIVLFPPAALMAFSNAAVPGDTMYPVKKGLESAVLLLASANPGTKAYFAVAQANRRYDETAIILSEGDNADSSLQNLVIQTSQAASDINKVDSTEQKSKLIADLSGSIEKYDQGLAQAQQEIERSSPGSQTPVAIPNPSVPAVTLTPSPPTTANTGSISAPTPQPSSAPTAQPVTSVSDGQARKQQESIEKTRKELEQLRLKLEQEQKNIEKNSQSVTAVPSPSPSRSPAQVPSPSQQPAQDSSRQKSENEKNQNKNVKNSESLNQQSKNDENKENSAIKGKDN